VPFEGATANSTIGYELGVVVPPHLLDTATDSRPFKGMHDVALNEICAVKRSDSE
jgi:hypothetical protein